MISGNQEEIICEHTAKGQENTRDGSSHVHVSMEHSNDAHNRLSPNSVTRRIGALQDLAAILDLTGINSDIVLPVNVESEGQVVLPVSDGQIDLVLRMVLPDFLQEILDRLDKILATDGKVSNTIESQGDIPESQGDIPESQGDIPESQGDIPESQGDIPESQGDIPESQGYIPESQGDIPELQGDIPESQGDIPDIPLEPSGCALKIGSDLPKSPKEAVMGDRPGVGSRPARPPRPTALPSFDRGTLGNRIQHVVQPREEIAHANNSPIDKELTHGVFADDIPTIEDRENIFTQPKVPQIDLFETDPRFPEQLGDTTGEEISSDNTSLAAPPAPYIADPVGTESAPALQIPIEGDDFTEEKFRDLSFTRPLKPLPTPPPRSKKHHHTSNQDLSCRKEPRLMPDDDADESKERELIQECEQLPHHDEAKKLFPVEDVSPHEEPHFSPTTFHPDEMAVLHKENIKNDETAFSKQPLSFSGNFFDETIKQHAEDGKDTSGNNGAISGNIATPSLSVQSMLDRINFLTESPNTMHYPEDVEGEQFDIKEEKEVEEEATRDEPDLMFSKPSRPPRPTHLPLLDQFDDTPLHVIQTQDERIEEDRENLLKQTPPSPPMYTSLQDMVPTDSESDGEATDSTHSIDIPVPPPPPPPLPPPPPPPPQRQSDEEGDLQVNREEPVILTPQRPPRHNVHSSDNEQQNQENERKESLGKPRRPPRPTVQPSFDKKHSFEEAQEATRPSRPTYMPPPPPSTALRPASSMPALNRDYSQIRQLERRPRKLPPPPPPIRLATSMSSLDHTTPESQPTEATKLHKPTRPPRPAAQPSLDTPQINPDPHKIDESVQKQNQMTFTKPMRPPPPPLEKDRSSKSLAEDTEVEGRNHASLDYLDSSPVSSLYPVISSETTPAATPTEKPERCFIPKVDEAVPFSPNLTHGYDNTSDLKSSLATEEAFVVQRDSPRRPPPPKLQPILDLKTPEKDSLNPDSEISLGKNETPRDSQDGEEEGNEEPSFFANTKMNFKRQLHVTGSTPNQSISDVIDPKSDSILLPRDQPLGDQSGYEQDEFQDEHQLADEAELSDASSFDNSAALEDNQQSKVEMMASDIASEIVESSIMNFPLNTKSTLARTPEYPNTSILGNFTSQDKDEITYQGRDVEEDNKHENSRLDPLLKGSLKATPDTIDIPINHSALGSGSTQTQKCYSVDEAPKTGLPYQEATTPLVVDSGKRDKAARNDHQPTLASSTQEIASGRSQSISSNFVWEHDDLNITVSVTSHEQAETRNRDKKMKIAINYDIKEQDAVVRNGTFNVEVKMPTGRGQRNEH